MAGPLSMGPEPWWSWLRMHKKKALATQLWGESLGNSCVFVVVSKVTNPPIPSLFLFTVHWIFLLRLSQELIAVDLVFHVWTMVEGLPFHHFTQGQRYGHADAHLISRVGVELSHDQQQGSHVILEAATTAALTWVTLQWTTYIVAGSNIS